MKVDEAKTKICPHIKLSDSIVPIDNGTTNANCQADKCMAWHWHCKFENDTLEFSTTDGYCRLIHEGER